MPKFDRSSIEELKECLYYSDTHDAVIESISYKRCDGCLIIEVFNPILNVKTDLIFHDVEIALSVKGDSFGNCEAISIIVAEDDFSYLQRHMPNYSGNAELSVYLLFEMISGDELHIVAKEVTIEITR